MPCFGRTFLIYYYKYIYKNVFIVNVLWPFYKLKTIWALYKWPFRALAYCFPAVLRLGLSLGYAQICALPWLCPAGNRICIALC